jgi:hypothetical protein
MRKKAVMAAPTADVAPTAGQAELAGAPNKKAGDEFLAANKSRSVVTLPADCNTRF